MEVGNAYGSFFRVTSLFRDPSLYARHVVIGIAIVVVAVLYRKLNPLLAVPLVGLLFAGVWFSYSQSSMAALFVVTFCARNGRRDAQPEARRGADGTRRPPRRRGSGARFRSRDHSARRFTSDRSRRVELTPRVFPTTPSKGSASAASRSPARRCPSASVADALRLALDAAHRGRGARDDRDRPLRRPPRRRAWLIVCVRRIDPALGLGLGAVLLALFVHSLSYSGFFEDPVTWLALGLGSSFLLARADDAAVPGCD